MKTVEVIGAVAPFVKTFPPPPYFQLLILIASLSALASSLGPEVSPLRFQADSSF